MKKVFAMVLCAAMLLTLAGCGSDGDYKGLYEKYSGIIDSLEAEDYSGAMSQVAGLAQQAMEESKEPQPEPQQVFCDSWYAYSMNDESAPAEFTVNADGTCTVGGQAMTWMVNISGENSVEAIINNGSENLYYIYCRRNENAAVMSYCEVYTCRNTEYGITSDKQLATYMSDPMAGTLIREWRLLEGDEAFTGNYLYIYRNSLSLNSNNCNWVITSEKGGDTLTAHAESESADGQYTLTLAQRDGHYVLTVTEDATGAAALYYSEEYGYEQTWPEAVYATAMRSMKDYLRNGGFWVDDVHYSENKALAWLYQTFGQIPDYKQSGEYLQRFTILPSLLTTVERINTDQLGNESKSTVLSYTYDENGRITVAKGSDFVETTGVNGNYTPQQLTYDDAGKLSGVTLGYINGTVEGIGTPTYDENGRLASMHVQKTNGEYTATFTYDDQGRVIGLEIPKHTYNNDVVFTYTYDDNGVPVQKVKTENEGYYTYTTDYTYENGALKEQLVTTAYRYGSGYTTKYVFTSDDQGRPLSAEITTTDTGNTYKAMRQEYTYEDIYFFDATGLTEAE